jgi:polyhydroxybutyrate depolymerase
VPAAAFGPSMAGMNRLVLTLGLVLATACGSQTDAQAPSPSSDGTGSGSGSSGVRGGSSGAGGSSGNGGTLDATASSESNGDAVDSGGDDDGSGNQDASNACVPSPSGTSGNSGYLGDWSAGDYPAAEDAGGIESQVYLTIPQNAGGTLGTLQRQYKVHVPSTYTADRPMPLLFCIHGLGQNAVMFCVDGAHFNEKSDADGFILVMPNGYNASWNGGDCCGGGTDNKLPDVQLMRDIYAEVITHLNVDTHRVYATGFSNGGYLSYRLGCEAADIFVAIAPISGAVGTAAIGGLGPNTDLTACNPSQKISVLDIHGTMDPLVPFSSQAPSLAIFQAANTCSSSTMPAVQPSSNGDGGTGTVSCVTYTGCPTCPNVEVTGCSVLNGGHCWYGASDCGFGVDGLLDTDASFSIGNNSSDINDTDAVWAFLERFAR